MGHVQVHTPELDRAVSDDCRCSPDAFDYDAIPADYDVLPADEADRRSVLGRVDVIFGAFDERNQVLSLNELTQRTVLPKSTVHRFAEQLRQIGWLEREVSGYRIGMRMFEVGGLAMRRSRLCEIAAPHLQALAVKTGFAVQMAILDGTDVVYLERIPMAGLVLPSREGGRIPAYCTGLGKAMLAFDDDAAQVVSKMRLEQRTANTICSPVHLANELRRIRDRGWAFDHQESYRGLACVAAPVRSNGRAIAAISVTGPVDRIDVQGLAPLVHTAAGTIWADRFGHKRPA
ncbi:MAG TPA: IclR family transcriptional regulator [Ilumatobacter sp.]|nr:IclR family transcriptional regulator [Ilumatobacter sp.]